MKLYKELTYKEVTALSANTLAYVSWDGHLRIPAFILPYPGKPNGLGFIYGKDAREFCTKWLPFETYKEEWTVDVENGFTVETPDGTLHAFDASSDEYPGIRIDLYRPNDPQPVALSMTEYTPGGEGIYGYDPIHPGRQKEEYDEVPVERIVDKDGKPIACKGEITDTSGHSITAGLVSRAWPNEIAEEDYHKRVFHTGYKGESKMNPNVKNLGTFMLKSGIMRVSDPCYDKATWCAGVIPDCRTGKWEALVTFCNDSLFGRRVSILAARAVDSNARFDLLNSLDTLEHANFEVGVDSGQAGMYDDETYGLDSMVTGIPNPSEKDSAECGELWYEYCCGITHGSKQAGVIPTGVVSRSGYGDGGYSAFFHKGEDGKVDLIAIRYIREDAKDDIEDYDEEDFSADDLARLIAITNDKGEVRNG